MMSIFAVKQGNPNSNNHSVKDIKMLMNAFGDTIHRVMKNREFTRNDTYINNPNYLKSLYEYV